MLSFIALVLDLLLWFAMAVIVLTVARSAVERWLPDGKVKRALLRWVI
jgi:hypothetical protein